MNKKEKRNLYLVLATMVFLFACLIFALITLNTVMNNYNSLAEIYNMCTDLLFYYNGGEFTKMSSFRTFW